MSHLLLSLKGLKCQNHHFSISAEFRKDLKCCQKLLHQFNSIFYIHQILWLRPDNDLSTDAYPTGAGGFSRREYLLTFMVGLKIWAHKFRNMRIQVFLRHVICFHSQFR